MNISKHLKQTLRIVRSALCITTLVASCAMADVTISGVSSRQRWPWNNLVDVDFTINGSAGEPYAIALSATCNGGATALTAKTFASEPVAAAGAASRVVWDLGADYPDLKADDFRVTVTATPLKDSTPVYMVVDLAAGASASAYPVRYTTTAPTPTAGQEDACKTTELWLRRIKAGTMDMGEPYCGGRSGYSDNGYRKHNVTLTDDYYIGIFPLTYAQYTRIGQSVDPSRQLMHFTNETCIATRPLDSVTLPCLRDSSYLFPQDSKVYNDNSILGRLRTRTGLDFDIPTEWQWEYAIRAGVYIGTYQNPDGRYAGAAWRNSPKPASSYEYYSEERMWDQRYGTALVDAGNPNAWGVYLVYGSIWEWCSNRKSSAITTTGLSFTDPLGDATDGDGKWYSTRGCGWTWGNSGISYVVSSGTRFRNYGEGANGTINGNTNNSNRYYQGVGARVIVQIRK